MTVLAGMIAEETPRLFAVIQESTEHLNGRIAASGMVFPDHAEAVSVGKEHG